MDKIANNMVANYESGMRGYNQKYFPHMSEEERLLYASEHVNEFGSDEEPAPYKVGRQRKPFNHTENILNLPKSDPTEKYARVFGGIYQPVYPVVAPTSPATN